MTNPNAPLRENTTVGQLVLFNKGSKNIDVKDLSKMTDVQVRRQGMKNLGKNALVGVGVLASGIALSAVALHAVESGSGGSLNNDREPYPSDREIAEINGGVVAPTQGEVQPSPVSPTDIHPIATH